MAETKVIRLVEHVHGDFGPDLAKALTPTLLREAQSSTRFKLVTRIEAIHEKISRNYVHYTERVLRGNPRFRRNGQLMPTGVYSWTSPYPKPILRHHDQFTDPIGRVSSAEYATKTRAGIPGIIVTAAILDPEAIEKVRDGRYLTVSIGASPDKLRCTICGADVTHSHPLFGEPHEHERGKVYNGKVAAVEPENLWFEELSFVNSPGDVDAQVIDPGELAAFEMVLIDLQTREVADLGRSRLLEVAPEALLSEGAFERDRAATMVVEHPLSSLARGGSDSMPPLKEGQAPATAEPAKNAAPPAADAAPAQDAKDSDEPVELNIPEELQEDPSVAGLIEILYQQQDDIEELEKELKASVERDGQVQEFLRQLRGRIDEVLKLYPSGDAGQVAGLTAESADGKAQATFNAGGVVITNATVTRAEPDTPTVQVDASLRAAYEQALERIAELEEKLRSFLAEQIVELRLSAGTLDASQAQAKREELAKRSLEALEELYEEQRSLAAMRQAAPPAPVVPPESVTIKTAEDLITPTRTKQSAEQASQKPEQLDASEVFRRLLRPRR